MNKVLLSTFVFLSALQITIAQNNFKNKIDTAIGKAFKYIENEKYNFSKDIFFQYLYTLKNNNLKTDTDIDRYASGLDSLDYKEFYALYDIIKTGNTKDRDCLYSDSIPFMNLFFQVMFIKTDSLSKDFFSSLEKVSKEGDYQLTHCYLSLTELKKNTKYLNKSQIKSLYFHHSILEKKIFNDVILKLPWDFTNSDIKTEAIDLLLMNKRSDLIKSTEIHKILNSQRKEGYWFIIDNNIENTDTTIASDVRYKEALKENFEFAKEHISLLVIDLLLNYKMQK